MPTFPSDPTSLAPELSERLQGRTPPAPKPTYFVYLVFSHDGGNDTLLTVHPTRESASRQAELQAVEGYDLFEGSNPAPSLEWDGDVLHVVGEDPGFFWTVEEWALQP